MSKRVITFGTFDIFHVGHLRLLQRASEMGTYLIVGVSTDCLNEEKKGRAPIYPFDQRCEILRSISIVNEVFAEESLEGKRQYILQHKADVLVMGNDWSGLFDEFNDICKVHYLKRTPSISTSATIESIRG